MFILKYTNIKKNQTKISKKKKKKRHYCCGRDIKNCFMVARDICDNRMHVNCINYSTGLSTVAVTYVCQRCIHDNFLGVINFLHYQIKKNLGQL